ncbi:DUF1344 domain-containing protein [Acidimangrovimonas sediminis]|uniref:DUF1344 domain-containing protein n=1 Tax=Acidimangrovimonas sediminis TaxID=2056283 RepID=UPI000C8041FB|nr:DUF1344 domain-containing protein [Acidimangrovimonas sediminis]
MRKILLPVVTIAALGFAGAALAKTETATGTVKMFDAKSHSLTLADGKTFHLTHKYKSHAFKAGEKVEVKWMMKGKTADATHVIKLKAAKAPAKPAKG